MRKNRYSAIRTDVFIYEYCSARFRQICEWANDFQILARLKSLVFQIPMTFRIEEKRPISFP